MPTRGEVGLLRGDRLERAELVVHLGDPLEHDLDQVLAGDLTGTDQRTLLQRRQLVQLGHGRDATGPRRCPAYVRAMRGWLPALLLVAACGGGPTTEPTPGPASTTGDLDVHLTGAQIDAQPLGPTQSQRPSATPKPRPTGASRPPLALLLRRHDEALLTVVRRSASRDDRLRLHRRAVLRPRPTLSWSAGLPPRDRRRHTLRDTAVRCRPRRRAGSVIERHPGSGVRRTAVPDPHGPVGRPDRARTLGLRAAR